MAYVSLALALVKLIGSLINYLHDQKMISAGEAMAVADALKEQADAVKKAGEVAAAERAAIERDGVRSPNEFSRD